MTLTSQPYSLVFSFYFFTFWETPTKIKRHKKLTSFGMAWKAWAEYFCVVEWVNSNGWLDMWKVHTQKSGIKITLPECQSEVNHHVVRGKTKNLSVWHRESEEDSYWKDNPESFSVWTITPGKRITLRNSTSVKWRTLLDHNTHFWWTHLLLKNMIQGK